MRMGCVYLARNTVNGKGYVGLTVRGLKTRKKRHEIAAAGGSTTPFHRALQKYGPNAFEWSVLCEAPSNDLNAEESWYIQVFETKTPNGYNLTNGGEGTFGYVFTEETKEKIRKKKTGLKVSEEGRRRIGLSKQGRKMSEEQKQKISAANKGRPKPAGFGEAVSKFHKGKKRPKETSERIRFALTGIKRTPEQNENMRQAQLKRQAKIRESSKDSKPRNE